MGRSVLNRSRMNYSSMNKSSIIRRQTSTIIRRAGFDCWIPIGGLTGNLVTDSRNIERDLMIFDMVVSRNKKRFF